MFWHSLMSAFSYLRSLICKKLDSKQKEFSKLVKENQALIIKVSRLYTNSLEDEQGNAVRKFDDKAIKALQNFSWTGNIRELRNVVERLIILGGNPVTAEDVADFVRK